MEGRRAFASSHCPDMHCMAVFGTPKLGRGWLIKRWLTIHPGELNVFAGGGAGGDLCRWEIAINNHNVVSMTRRT